MEGSLQDVRHLNPAVAEGSLRMTVADVRRMHMMVKAWTTPTVTASLVSGLVSFGRLCDLTDSLIAAFVEKCEGRVEVDITSPGGKFLFFHIVKT